MQARHCLSLLLLSFTVGLANAAPATPEYRVTVMGPANSRASDINQAGVVVGHYPAASGALHGFLNRGKGLVDIGTLGGSASDALAINDKGQVLGHWTSASGQRRGLIYHHGAARDIGVIPGRLTSFTDINNEGYITANGVVAGGFDGDHGFLRAPNGVYRDIGALPFDNPMTDAYALNDRRQIAGASGPLTFPDQPLRAFIWSKGVMRDLGGLGWEPNYGRAINERGQITGSVSLPVGFRNRKAFLYTHGRLSDIDGRPDTEERWSEGTGINNHGHVVGNSNHLSGFIYRGKRMQSLNGMINPAPGWDISEPEAINDAGQIAATAVRAGVRYAVRLDLIRPHALQVPLWEIEGGLLPQADDAAEQAAQAREVLQPVPQF